MSGFTHRARSDHDRRFGVRRAEVLSTLRSTPEGSSIRDLAQATGLHENTVRFHLTRLVQEGLVERRPRLAGGPGRPPMVYASRDEPALPGRDNYELIARVLAGGLGAGTPDAQEAARRHGEAWARAQQEPGSEQGSEQGRERDEEPAPTFADSLGLLDRFLRRAGFAPEVAPGDGQVQVRLHNCPFRSMAEEDRAVPCAVHRGLMQGVLDGAGGGGRVEELEPFVRPSLCRASVTTG